VVRLKKIATGTTGSEIAEAALVLPIFFLIMLGIYWFGRAFNTYATINHAAREGARAAVAQTCATCGSPNIPLTTNQCHPSQAVPPSFQPRSDPGTKSRRKSHSVRRSRNHELPSAQLRTADLRLL
jgi:hypothetical protein